MKFLDCGCARVGGPEHMCMCCRHTACEEHCTVPHDCPECPACLVRHGHPLHEWVAGRLTVVGL